MDYGGNRHGFLAFTEIHPDYYQIPVADRQALLEEEAEEQSRASAAEAAEDDAAAGRRRGRRAPWRSRPPLRPPGRRQGWRPGRRARPKPRRPSEVRKSKTKPPRPGVALEASDLVHEVSEPAGRPPEPDEGDEAEDNAPAEASHREAEEAPHHEDEDDDEAEPAETVGQPVAVGVKAMATLPPTASNRSARRTRWKRCPSGHGAGAGVPTRSRR